MNNFNATRTSPVACLAAGAVALAITVLPDPADAARRCRSPLPVTGPVAVSRELAEQASLRAWSEQAAKLGAGFKIWDNAIGRDLSCDSVEPAGFKCVANGSPCTVRK